MRARSRREGGFTLLEIVGASAITIVLVGSAIRLLLTTEDLAFTATQQRSASQRVERVLTRIGAELRRSSLGSAQHADASTFADGDTGNALSIQPVSGWEGAAVLGDRIEYRLDVPAGETEGDLIRDDGIIETLVARRISGFDVERDGPVFTITISARSGPADDRERESTGSLSVLTRNR